MLNETFDVIIEKLIKVLPIKSFSEDMNAFPRLLAATTLKVSSSTNNPALNVVKYSDVGETV